MFGGSILARNDLVVFRENTDGLLDVSSRRLFFGAIVVEVAVIEKVCSVAGCE